MQSSISVTTHEHPNVTNIDVPNPPGPSTPEPPPVKKCVSNAGPSTPEPPPVKRQNAQPWEPKYFDPKDFKAAAAPPYCPIKFEPGVPAIVPPQPPLQPQNAEAEVLRLAALLFFAGVISGALVYASFSQPILE